MSKTFTAFHNTQQAAQLLLSADTLERQNMRGRSYVAMAIEHLHKAADALGYTLERQPLNVMPTATFMDKINRATATIPVSELMHGTPNANDLMSDTLGNVVGPR